MLHLARGLKARSHQQWIVGQPTSPLLKNAGAEGLEAFALNMPSEFNPGAIWKLSRLLKKLRIQVIHMHTSRACTLGGLAAKIAKVKVKVISRRVDFSIKKNPLRRLKYGWNIDRIIAVSDGVRDVLINDGLDPERIVVIHSGTDVSLFKPDLSPEPFRKEIGVAPAQRLVGTVAHFAEHKGHRFLLEAAQDVIKQWPEIHFVLVGDGELFHTMKEWTKTLGIQDHVTFTGFREDIPNILVALDLFVLASTHGEGHSGVLREALACQVPVVATNISGNREVVEDGVTGFLVPPGEPKAMADSISRTLSDPAQARLMGEAGRRRVVEHFSADAMVDQTEKIYYQSLEQKGKPFL